VTGGSLLFEPAAIRNRQGRPFQVFTPFWRTCRALDVEAPRTLPAGPFLAPSRWPRGCELEALRLAPSLQWDAGFYPFWEPGEAGAIRRLRAFAPPRLDAYGTTRDIPAEPGTSLLSPHLHFGEISPRQVWAAVRRACTETRGYLPTAGANKFLDELGWREFAHHVLVNFPHTPERPLRAEFERFAWAADPGGKRWRAWRRGETGYPLVDAGLRQLWQTGWMHNRVRMVVASFLVKHLRLPWSEGAAWFWDTLVDADLAANTLNWQWSAGCGADAAPYFRIFAPVTQSEKFDPQGDYIRRWIPALARVPSESIHAPWESPAVLASAGVTLGRDYPYPIVDHRTARAEALDAFHRLKG
jgi:deoxyribodipyrimidine photo-lyase